jgi:hypothetical protein
MSTRTEYVPGKPTRSQSDLLGEAVLMAYKAGWKGSIREKVSPRLPGWATMPTTNSLRSKGLVEPRAEGEYPVEKRLTKYGIAAGEENYKLRFGLSAKEQADRAAKEKQKIAQDAQDRKDKVKHLFRGMHISRGAGFNAKKKGKRGRSIAAHIDRSSSIQMNIDDLIVLGEQIEKLR